MPPITPAGRIVTAVPAVALTSFIFDRTLVRATSMLMISAILMANIRIIAPDLSGLRSEFFTPLVKRSQDFLLVLIID
jgi:hypothetical protein